MKALNKHTDLTETPFLWKVIAMAVPLAVTSMLQMLFHAADVIVVGNFAGPIALAAVGSNGSIVKLLVNTFLGLSIGGNIVAAHYIGEQNHAMVRNTVHTLMFIGLFGGIAVGIGGFFLTYPMLNLVSSPPDVIDQAAVYLRIYFCGMPFFMVYNFGASILRAAGDTQRPLICLTAAGILNVVLNLLFVVVFRMSVVGVGLATVISQGLSAVLIVTVLMKEQEDLHLDWDQLSLEPQIFREVLRAGIPAALQNAAFSISNMSVQSCVNSLGSTVVAGDSASGSIEDIVYLGVNACQQTCVVITSQNMGAKKYRNLKRVIGACLMCAMVFSGVMGLSVWLGGPWLLSFYTSDAAVIRAGMVRLMTMGYTYTICGAMDVMAGALRGLGHSLLSMLMALFGCCVLRILCSVYIFPLYNNLDVLYWCRSATWAVALLGEIVCYYFIMRSIKRRQEEQNLAFQ